MILGGVKLKLTNIRALIAYLKVMSFCIFLAHGIGNMNRAPRRKELASGQAVFLSAKNMNILLGVSHYDYLFPTHS